DYRTVLPEAMGNAAMDAAERFPHKRLIVHFMQPHTPYLERESVFPDDHGVTKRVLDESPEELRTMIRAVGHETVWKAYRHTLEVALDDVFRVVRELNGKTVVSADHGELFGDRVPPLYTKLYGHKTGVRYPSLVRVPWAVSNGDRRRIRDDGVSATDSDTDKIESQLEALGYK
ncbi:MAG: hypothetical protein ABEI99_03590, partial [Halobaculum sp.]